MMESQYNKFEYRDLNKGGHFVEAPIKDLSDRKTFQKDRIISEVVSEHFSDKLDNASDTSVWCDIKTHKIVEEVTSDVELNAIKTHSFSEDGQSLDLPLSSPAKAVPCPEIDIEKIKEESYQRGYKEAESLLTPKLETKVAEDNLHNLLKEKLSATPPSADLGNSMFEIAAGLIAILAKKLHLAVPADFEAIILGEMMPIINKYYKKGKVIARVNPERVDYCNNLFRIGELAERLSENIELVPDEGVAKNDCSIEWDAARLEYHQEDLLTEADKILDHLKMKIEN
jgi:flagellar biosynthesis/type III secretory pathway protein FliH